MNSEMREGIVGTMYGRSRGDEASCIVTDKPQAPDGAARAKPQETKPRLN